HWDRSIRLVEESEHREASSRMLENGATRQQIADVVGVGTKSIYKYLPVGIPTKSKALPQ
ncbi:helix-turn-helix domain-containing protein, partial [Klebsiella sp. FR21MBA2675]|uniref:helix-turn-helix domain-containing protein n=1 Tax=Klebsiella sp. FR21MBA2675 TaxID=3381300 RepID=UPI003A97BA1F